MGQMSREASSWREQLKSNSVLLSFDTREYDFAGVVLTGLNAHLKLEGLPVIDRLQNIHRLPHIEQNIESYRQHLFSVFRSPEFQTVFKAFGKHLIDTYLDKRALLQRSPTARIQLPHGGKSVSFHTDGWYGHGDTVFSFWMPLVPVSGNSSLQMAVDVPRSLEVIKKIKESEMDLEGINELGKQVCDPVEADFGKLLSFTSSMIHGTVINDTDRCRVSFDFRIAQSAKDIGNKPLSNYFTYEELAGGERLIESGTRIKRAWMFAGVCGMASAKSQLVFINEYCKINRIDIAGSESEMVTMMHAPVLQSYLSNAGGNYDGVVVFSVQYLPRKRSTRDEIYRRSLDNGVKILFATEDVILATAADIERVESALQVYRS
jgi:sporadic carbohydrate cluster protein (TIGR04323 family)